MGLGFSRSRRAKTIDELPPVLLGHLWPGERVVLGIRVSKSIRETLLEHAAVVQFRCKPLEEVLFAAQGDVFNDLKRFQHAKHVLSLQLVNTKMLLAESESTSAHPSSVLELWAGILLGIRELSDGNLLHLNLTNWNWSLASGNQSQSSMKLTRALQGCTSLTYLNLGGNSLGRTSANSLREIIGNCVGSLQWVDLSGNHLGDESVTALAPALGQCHSLRSLNLGSNQLNPEGIAQLSTLGQGTSLRSLCFSANCLGFSGPGMLREVVQSRLTSLDLASNAIGGEGASRLRWMADQFGELKILNLAHNELGPAGAGILGWTLMKCPSLEYVNLRLNNFESLGASWITGPLRRCGETCRCVDLAGNAIGDDGALSIAKLLLDMPALSHLNLADNQIMVGGAEHLAETLARCTTLEYLNLQCNAIEDEGVAHLLPALEQARLRFLNVGWNNIGERGGWKLMKALMMNPVMEQIIMEGNAVEEKVEAQMMSYLEYFTQNGHMPQRDLSYEHVLSFTPEQTWEEWISPWIEASAA